MSDDSEEDIGHAKRIMSVQLNRGEHAFSDNLAGLLYALQTATACAGEPPGSSGRAPVPAPKSASLNANPAKKP